MEGVIPNSKVVILPPPPEGGGWRKELYLRPGDWIPWVTVTVVAGTVLLAIIVLVLHLNEKVSLVLTWLACNCSLAWLVAGRRTGAEKNVSPYQFRCSMIRL